jgi:hypothetical protein
LLLPLFLLLVLFLLLLLLLLPPLLILLLLPWLIGFPVSLSPVPLLPPPSKARVTSDESASVECFSAPLLAIFI